MEVTDLIRECQERSASKEAGYDKQLLADAASALMTLSAAPTVVVASEPVSGEAESAQ